MNNNHFTGLLLNTPHHRHQNINLTRAIVVLGLASLFYFYDFLIRVLPSAMTDELKQLFNTHATGLGLISTLFYWGYALMQVPSGLLLDRFGPKRLLTLATVIAAVTTYLFAITHQLWIILVARFLMGMVSAFAFLGALLLASRWFAPRHYALIVGLVQIIGSLGAIIGEGPIVLFKQQHGVLDTIIAIAILGLGLAVLIAIFVRDYPKHKEKLYQEHQLVGEWRRLKRVCRKPQNWWCGLQAAVCWTPMIIFAEFWGVPYLQKTHHLSEVAAASMISITWLSVIVSGPLLGWFSTRLSNRRIPLLIGSFCGFLSTFSLVHCPELSQIGLALGLIGLGIAGASMAITFALIQDNNTHQLTGTAAGFNNFLLLMGGVVCQPIVGFLLDWHRTGAHANAADYHAALCWLPLISVVGIIVTTFCIRETHARPQNTHS